MKTYTRFEVAAIFARCETQEEVFKVCRLFKYFADEFGDKLPMYIAIWGNLRHRHILLRKNTEE